MKTIALPKGLVALVDDEDFEWLSQSHWGLQWSSGKFYASYQRKKKGRAKTVLMHRLIIGAEKGQQVDHQNGQTLDNQRKNLRLCNASQNVANSRRNRNNTSGFKGVSANRKRWKAQIGSLDCGTFKHLGTFDTKEEAALAYDAEATSRYGSLL